MTPPPADLTAAQGAQIEDDLGRYQAHPMPPELREQIAGRIEAHTMNMQIKHRDVMECVDVAWLVISDWFRQRAGDLIVPP